MPSVRDNVGNLPVELTSFIGRRREIAGARRLLSTSRLVTLTGVGGVGKTRLAVRVAEDLRRSFADGAWLVELGELHDSELLAETVAAALGLPDQRGRSLSGLLVDHLATRQTLVVLDNCEHLLSTVAALAETLLRGCPELRLVATSREVLGVDGEQELRVPPLTVPDADHLPPLEALPRYEAVVLFVARAGAAVPDFALTEANYGAVAAICGRLDGLPLAIELAAARMRAMSAEQIVQRLADRYQLLTVGFRGAPTRQQTLRACVDWSYELCGAREQRLWAWLSVFAGSFELDAAEEICPEELVAGDLLDGVTSLVDKSVLIREQLEGVVRFTMPETIREYGSDKLRESGNYPTAQRRHLAWYERLVLRAESEWISDHQVDWIIRLKREQPNLRDALTLSLTDSVADTDPGVSARMVSALYLFWTCQGLWAEARHWLDRSLARSDTEQAAERPVMLYDDSVLAGMQGQLDEAAARVAQCQTLAEQRGDAESVEVVDYVTGFLSLFGGNLTGAVVSLQSAVTSTGVLPENETGMKAARLISGLLGLAAASGLLGDGKTAVACYEQVLDITTPRGESYYRGYSLWAVGLTALRSGDTDRASALLERALRLTRLVNDPFVTGWSIESLAWIAIRERRPTSAAVLMGAAKTLSRTVGGASATLPHLISKHDECEQLARDALGKRAYEKAFQVGAAMGLDESVAYALGDQAAQAPTKPAASVLTRRETEVANLVAAGLTNREIAARLVISPRTAQGHVERTLSKLGFTSRTQIAAWVAENHQAPHL
ncbi:ATP-binding protein [Rhodococcus sp. MTM3W5.2]|uniref:ATP-binding protein n=1 Tax=Rhodococcus sp. MTM3W5.2 TaxID=1805827 RepID=UPI00097C4A00|nr:LuxR C-terminal-related transcriptional regulator [Rhodococcus sp. MTM3W5.2]